MKVEVGIVNGLRGKKAVWNARLIALYKIIRKKDGKMEM